MSQIVGYAGDVSPEAAWTALASDSDARLVDVRTTAEWAYVGLPDLGPLGKAPVMVEWKRFPSMTTNPGFAEAVAAAGVSKGAALYFLCRSGVRSRDAAVAMTALGYGPCFNVATGFEGDRDAAGHRGTLGGWKVDGLPWRQG